MHLFLKSSLKGKAAGVPRIWHVVWYATEIKAHQKALMQLLNIHVVLTLW